VTRRAKPVSFVLCVIALAALFEGLTPRPACAEPVIIFAASSLSGALDAVAEEYKNSTSADIRVSYAASSALARQIGRGAPAHIFISANTAWSAYLEERQALQTSSKFTLVRNRLVLAAPTRIVSPVQELTAKYLQSRLKSGRLVIADPAHVPAGIYAREALEKLGLWHAVQHRLAPAINVRAALALLERQEAPLGVLYRTDVLNSEKVQLVYTFPTTSHSPISYMAALTKRNSGKDVLNFFRYLKSPLAATRLCQFGFDPA